MTPRHAWMTKGLMRSCIKKSVLYKKYCTYGTSVNRDRYIAYRNKLKTLLKIAEKRYYSEQIRQAHGNMRQTWKVIGSVLNQNTLSKISESFKINGANVTNPVEITEKFNDFFTTIGCNLAEHIPDSETCFTDYLTGQCNKNSFFIQPTSCSEVIEIVDQLKSKTSYGVDGIPISIIKATIQNIAEPLSRLINCSISTGVFPANLKIGKICPVYKDGEKDSFSNYRPISVLPSFSKIFEKIVSVRLYSYFDSNNIFSRVQYGFRQNHSTYMAILDMYSRISSALDRSEFSIGIFIDLSKAFDTLNHSILLHKLEYYGIRGLPLKWLESYLLNRQQCVCINNTTSSLKYVTCGVPQGSILGPLMFLIYINDIVKCSPTLDKILFADDTNLFHSDKNIQNLFNTVNSELSSLSNWFKANKMSLNIKKTKYILFTNKKVDLIGLNLDLNIDGIVLDCVDSTKFLGVIVDKKLSWHDHINHISSKISRGLGILGRVRRLLPREILLLLYHTLIYPYLSYCCIAWGRAAKNVLSRLIILQKRAVRIITGAEYRASTGSLFKELNILKLADICLFQTSQFMFNFKNGLLPIACSDFCMWSDSIVYNIRHHSVFKAPPFRTLVYERSIRVSGPKQWDSLSPDLQNISNLVLFKLKLKLCLIAKYT